MEQAIQQQEKLLKMKMLKALKRSHSNNAFTTSTNIKRIFTLVSFAIYFGLICYVIFQIGKMPKTMSEVMKYSWLSMMISFMWLAARVSNSNLSISYTTVNISFVMAIVMNVYVTAFVALKAQVVPNQWNDLINQYYWWIPIMAWNALWKLMFACFERRARPYFALQKFLNFVSNLFMIVVIVYGAVFIKRFAIDRHHFNYLDTYTFTGLALITFGVLVIAISVIADLFYFSKHSKVETKALKSVRLWSALLHIGPVAVWFIIKGSILHSSQNFNLTYGLREILFTVEATLAVVVTWWVALTKREAGGSSKVFLLTSTSMIALISISGYFYQIWWKADAYTMIVIIVSSMSLIIIANIFHNPEAPRSYAFVYGLLFTMIAGYCLVLWLLQDVVLKGIQLPFHIYDVIFLVPLILSILLEGIALTSYWWTISQISKYSTRVLKINNNKINVTNNRNSDISLTSKTSEEPKKTKKQKIEAPEGVKNE